MIINRLEMSPAELAERTGWELKPEGACRGDVCVPMGGLRIDGGQVDVQDFARRMGMPVAHDEKHGVWALGPRSGGHALESVDVPDLVLDDFSGNAFDVASLRGRKVFLLAWASY
jgi:hypothetical protein